MPRSGCPYRANPHWPVWAAREPGDAGPFPLARDDRAGWLRDFPAHGAYVGWPVEDTPDGRKLETA